MDLVLPASIAGEMLAHAAAEIPNEACGLVAGDMALARATEFHPARNVAASPYVYEVHPEDLVRIMCRIDDDGRDLVAIFHSHPRTAATPSPTDVRSAEYRVLYIVAGGTDGPGTLRAWRLEDGEAREASLLISG